jgi:dihydrofolate reductase
MLISAIVAMSENRVIGKDNQLPWHLPADLKHFKEITMGKPILMGRKTYESIGRLLPGRENVIITRNADFKVPGAQVFHSPLAAIAGMRQYPEIMVIGGSELYQVMFPLFNRIYMTLVYANIEGDSYFPEVNLADWKLVSQIEHEADEKNTFDYDFLVWERK